MRSPLSSPEILHVAAVALLTMGLATACGREEPPPFVPAADAAAVRSLTLGEVVGFETQDGAHAWRGLPFAAPPVGDLRWRSPRPPAAWPGRREALTHGAPCAQLAGLLVPRAEGIEDGAPMGSEDCLTLDVYAPVFEPDTVPRADARLPVMVWIHGGGNTIGSTHTYDGSILAREHGVVVVTVQYRLGALGWFSHPALHNPTEPAEDRSGNYGTLDLVRSLEWVRDHIAAFGGDPTRVTIFGESAGGTDVFSLLLSPAAKGLFHRAISQSGGIGTVPLKEARARVVEGGHEFSSSEVAAQLLVSAGRAEDVEQAHAALGQWSAAEVGEFLRGVSSESLLGVYSGGGFGGMYSLPKLFRDGAVLPDGDAFEVLRSGEGVNRVPAIFGTNRDEVKLFMLGTSPDVARLFGVPLWLRDELRYDLVSEYGSKMWKARGADEPATALAARAGPPVFVYRFDWDEEPEVWMADLSKLLGAAHGLEIPFVFGRLRFPGPAGYVFSEEARPAAKKLSDAMASYWTRFAEVGDPGRGRGDDLPLWSPWQPEGGAEPNFAVLDTDADGGIRMETGALTKESVIWLAEADDRFENTRDRCAIFHEFVRRSEVMSEAAYAAIAGGACVEYPLDGFPWD